MSSCKNAVLVGRFQHIHIGHQKLIDMGLKIADRLLVFVSSSDKSKTERNPYEAKYRIELISKIYNKEISEGKLILKPLEDLTNENDLTYKWGDYVIKTAEDVLDEKLECIIYGKDKNIFKCFSKQAVDNISEIFVDRKQLLISATKIREMLLSNDVDSWKDYTSEKIHSEYSKLREILLEVMNNIDKE